MKKLSMIPLMMTLVSAPTLAEELNIGVSFFNLDERFIIGLRESLEEAAEAQGMDINVEDARNDIGRQLSQVQNFIAGGVDGIIVNPVHSDSTSAMSQAAANAGIPLVYVNRQPVDIESLPEGQAFVGSDEKESGTLQTQEVCRQLGGEGELLVMMGTLGDNAAEVRTQDVHDVIATPECSGLEIVEQQEADFQRIEGNNLMTNWLTSGLEFDAVIANNDEMAIGAIQALKNIGYDMDDVIVAGIDATSDALSAMQAGELDITVFQNGPAQGEGAVNTLNRLIEGEDVDNAVWVPFELVTPDNLDEYIGRN
ncbi:sugar ABC transporter substrate-binding protein [Halomonas sp. HAL1]|uniref:sugar ABC transporter substrate-binding protein n=1 Tax=Halomonas sp. HAL1 TaxID=550984 RepID=UPI00022D29BC|nr:sugar ABC transporter substrate-binding protein [Halomonas sp. HAL1]EHA14719.1 sugar ABC transporter periplasmic protein [Halomonas sp. HAL1]WKV93426.1 sugar ABC transporter substrate-binding protein [Halomonas sp. HAL1]